MQRPLFTRQIHMHLTPAESLAIGRRASRQCWGVTAGNARHNSSNVRGVTAGKVGRNSSMRNRGSIPLAYENCLCLSDVSIHPYRISLTTFQ